MHQQSINNAILDTAAANSMLRVFLCPKVAQYSIPNSGNDTEIRFTGISENAGKNTETRLAGIPENTGKNTEMVFERRCFERYRPSVFEVGVHHCAPLNTPTTPFFFLATFRVSTGGHRAPGQPPQKHGVWRRFFFRRPLADLERAPLPTQFEYFAAFNLRPD